MTNFVKIILAIIVLKLLYAGVNSVIDNSTESSDEWPPIEAYDSVRESHSAVIGLTTSAIRKYKESDTFTATMEIRERSSSQSERIDVTITVGDIIQNPFGVDCRPMAASGIIYGDQAYSIKWLFHQDANNSMYNCGEFKEELGRYVFLTNTAVTPKGIFLELKSPMQVGDSSFGKVYFDDGTWQECTTSVDYKEDVKTLIGIYESYKSTESCLFSNGDSSLNMMWTVPSIDTLKEVGTIKNADNMKGMEIEISIKSYDFK